MYELSPVTPRSLSCMGGAHQSAGQVQHWTLTYIICHLTARCAAGLCEWDFEKLVVSFLALSELPLFLPPPHSTKAVCHPGTEVRGVSHLPLLWVLSQAWVLVQNLPGFIC